MPMKNIIVVGHKNPDTDSAMSAIVYSEIKAKLKQKTVACIVGDVNNETKFILKNLKIKAPKKIETLDAEQEVILLDHSEKAQSPSGIENAKIIEIIDHHKLGGVTTGEPIYYRNEPLGSTCSIVAKIAKEKGIKLNKIQAGLLLCGIISDTIKFTSPSSTKEDEKIGKELAKISKLNINKMAEQMFEAKSDISGMSTLEIISADYKEFDAGNGAKFGFGVYETLNPNPLWTRKEEIVRLLSEKKKQDNLSLIFFAAVDIAKQRSYLFMIGEQEIATAKKAFNGKNFAEGVMALEKIVSRKKQMIPAIVSSL